MTKTINFHLFNLYFSEEVDLRDWGYDEEYWEEMSLEERNVALELIGKEIINQYSWFSFGSPETEHGKI